MNDIQGYQNGPIEAGASRAKEMSPRAYNLTMSALIFLGFCAMGAGAYFTSTMAFARMMMSGAALPLVFGSFILTIVGMVMMYNRGNPWYAFGLTMPYAAQSNFELVDTLKGVHSLLANIGYFVVGLHALAALMHHYLWKDNTLLRMMPRRR